MSYHHNNNKSYSSQLPVNPCDYFEVVELTSNRTFWSGYVRTKSGIDAEVENVFVVTLQATVNIYVILFCNSFYSTGIILYI